MDIVGRTNPNAKEWYCTRTDCLLCQGRKIVGAEEGEETLKRAEGHQVPRRKQEERKALP